MIIGKKPELIEPILTKVEATINDINTNRGKSWNKVDCVMELHCPLCHVTLSESR